MDAQANVLISDKGIPQLSDFGLSLIVNDLLQDDPDLLSTETSTANQGGALRWLAPELLGLPDSPAYKLTKQTDIYSFAMTIIEVLWPTIPFLVVCSLALDVVGFYRETTVS